MTATVTQFPARPANAAPDPCEIIAGLMVGARITPAQAGRAADRLAEVVPSTAKFRRGVLAAYFDLTATAS